MTESELRWSGTACSLGDVLVDQCRGTEESVRCRRGLVHEPWAW